MILLVYNGVSQFRNEKRVWCNSWRPWPTEIPTWLPFLLRFSSCLVGFNRLELLNEIIIQEILIKWWRNEQKVISSHPRRLFYAVIKERRLPMTREGVSWERLGVPKRVCSLAVFNMRWCICLFFLFDCSRTLRWLGTRHHEADPSVWKWARSHQVPTLWTLLEI